MPVIICENDGAMEGLFQTPAVTAFDAVSSFLSAAAYALVALAAVAHAPRDPRTRVFLAIALAGVAPYGITALIWERGSQVATTKAAIVIVGFSLLMGSLLLFHFTQVFPWRRPWIRARAQWLWFGYAGVIALTALGAFLTPSFDVAATGSGGLGAVSDDFTIVSVLVVLAILIPVLLLLGVVIPLAGLLSLYKSWQTARAQGLDDARRVTFWMLVSQMAGGVLTILIIPLLHLVAPRGPWVTIAATLLYACGLLMPIAFAAAVWRFRLLDVPDVSNGAFPQ
jgi:hypothetical protein